ncbi:MAG: SHOCT domain-containing protein [Bacteroidales bacterium]|nr:SHOCT domain-containing protein [Bacteroidales bacterium]
MEKSVKNPHSKDAVALAVLLVGLFVGIIVATIGLATSTDKWAFEPNWGLVGFGCVIILLSFIMWVVLLPIKNGTAEISNETLPELQPPEAQITDLDRLSKLGQLKADGIISEEEFQTLKAKILNL